jgi:hypothetical protein
MENRYREMQRSNAALRLQSSLLDDARRVPEAEGVALNQFINVAARSYRLYEPKRIFGNGLNEETLTRRSAC